ncbi:hypothetical protein SAMN05192566_2380 [Methylophilus rhizosphaerae]|uniref:Uncharacterized protein n=1 Tax=Methylophilus rhizosphaerae TaxID=492660 RepID=A0A1G9EQ14_9PROT|nr:hypothetical protein SAMN05192566_2380 [Methylophilus rhizosphaerae]
MSGDQDMQCLIALEQGWEIWHLDLNNYRKLVA